MSGCNQASGHQQSVDHTTTFPWSTGLSKMKNDGMFILVSPTTHSTERVPKIPFESSLEYQSHVLVLNNQPKRALNQLTMSRSRVR